MATNNFPHPPHTKERKRSSRGERLVIIILLIIATLGWIFKKELVSFINTSDIDTGSLSTQDTFYMGEELRLSGELTKNDDTSYPYTHEIEDKKYGKLGLRSSSINLYALTGNVEIQGKIVDYTNSLYILEVTEASTEEIKNQDQTLYFSVPGLLLNNIAKKGFIITQSKAKETISIDNETNGDHIDIRYFSCGTDELINCENYKKTLQKDNNYSQDTYGTTYYILEDRQSRFTELDGRYGVIIEVSRHQLFPYIIENTEFITKNWVQKNLLTSAKNTCINNNNSHLQEILEQDLYQEDDTFIRSLTGTDTQKNTIICEIQFNPSDLRGSLKTSVEESKNILTGEDNQLPEAPEDEDKESEKTPEKDGEKEPAKEPVSDKKISSNSHEQFPLRKDKNLEFITNQGDTIVFPSPNIYFESQNTLVGPNNQKCSIEMKVIQYDNREDIETNPSVKIYFCDANIKESGNNFRIIDREDSIILIEALDPSWINFANNIEVH